MLKPTESDLRLAQIVSLVLIPVIIFIGSCQIQKSISDASVKLEYVKMAINILREKLPEEKKTQPSLRPWATKIIDEYSAVKLSEDERKGLESGKVFITSAASTDVNSTFINPWGWGGQQNHLPFVPKLQNDSR